MQQIIEGVRYDADKATLVASDDYWDGSNRKRHGRNTCLYKSPRGRWFVLHATQWQGERDRIETVDEDRALELYERCGSVFAVDARSGRIYLRRERFYS